MKVSNTVVLLIGAAVVIVFEVIFFAPLVEWGIEKSATAAVGARVDVGDVNAGLHNLSFEIIDLHVTDKNNTMRNLVAVERIAFKMNFLALLEAKKVVEIVAVENVRMNTERSYDGAIDKKKKDKADTGEEDASEEGGGFSLDMGDVPGQEEIEKYTKGDLETIGALKELSTNAKDISSKWQDEFGSMDYDTRAQAIGERIENFDTSVDTSDIAKAQQDAQKKIRTLKETKDELDALTQELKQKKKEFDDDYAALDKEIAAVDDFRKKEIDGILGKLNIQGITLENVADILFGPALTDRIQNGLYWFGVVRKYMPRASDEKPKEEEQTFGDMGYDVYFSVTNAYPAYLVERINITSSREGVEDATYPIINGRINNITSDQDVRNTPTSATLEIVIPEYKLFRGNVGALFDRRDDMAIDTYHIMADNLPVENIKFDSGVKGFPSELKNARLRADADAAFDDEGLSLALTLFLSEMELAFDGEAPDDEFSKILSDTLADVDEARFYITVKQYEGETDIDIESNLDKLLSDNLSALVGEKVVALRKDVETAIHERVSKEKSAVMNDIDGEKKKALSEYDKQRAAVNDEKAKVDEKIEEVNGKLDAYKNKLDAEKERVQKETQKKVDKKKEETQEKVKEEATDKLKDVKIPGGF